MEPEYIILIRQQCCVVEIFEKIIRTEKLAVHCMGEIFGGATPRIQDSLAGGRRS